MTDYPPPLDQRYGHAQSDLLRRIGYLEQALAQLVIGAVPCLSTAHPANPATGMEIFETDTGATAVWTGTAWCYPVQQLAPTTVLSSSQASVTLSVPPGWTRVQVFWRARATDAQVAESLYLQFNGDTGSHYLWENVQANNAGAVSGGTSAGTATQIQVGTIPAGTATAMYFASGNFTVSGVSDTADFATVAGVGAAFATATNSWAGTFGGMWGQSGVVVSSLRLFPANGGASFAAGSTFTVYGTM